MLKAIVDLFNGAVKGITLFSAFLFGRRTVQRDAEKRARKNAEKNAKHWANRPRSRAELVKRLRQRADDTD